ncbi:glutathione S-transferase [Mycena maculata]|uniref:glutathione transferase n=1 Tax=Mycena maculata TaxID=230809 RepID=A0AAD7KCY0_9AGAR|nr:glutathione S-transferase [Mycena maculata]
MVLKLYAGGTRASGGSGIVAMVLAEKNIPFEVVLVDMAKGEHKSAEFLAMHPFGQVPVIDDDGFILYESRAICRYLAEKYSGQGTPLYPADLKRRALVEQGASVEFANFHPQVLKVATEAFEKPRRGLSVDEALLAEAVSGLSTMLDVYEIILGKQKFLAGDEFTLCDLFHLTYAPQGAGAGLDIMTSKGPNVARWWNELISRPTWVKLWEEGIKSTVN